jgi:hypothetical protein
MKIAAATSTLLCALTWPATACPVCDSETGATVRAGIFNSAFPVTLLEVLSPFLVTGAVLYMLQRHLPE